MRVAKFFKKFAIEIGGAALTIGSITAMAMGAPGTPDWNGSSDSQLVVVVEAAAETQHN